MKSLVLMALAMMMATAGVVSSPNASGRNSPESLSTHYESIRQALLHDTLKDVSAHAKAMETLAVSLGKSAPPQAALSGRTSAPNVTQTLASIERSSAALGKAADLKSAREAFGDLSTQMIAYQKTTAKAADVVVYCSMAKKSWLQPKGEIGNPYYGQSMARCGQVVSQ